MELMKNFLSDAAAARTLDEYFTLVNRLKREHGGIYPSWWFEVMIASGYQKAILKSLPVDQIIQIQST